MLKKLIVTLTVLLSAFSFCYAAYGESERIIYPIENSDRVIQKVEKVDSSTYKTRDLYSSEGLNKADAYNDIRNAMLEHRESVDLLKYGFKYDENIDDIENLLWEVFQRAAYKTPSSFSIYNSMKNIRVLSDGTIYEIGINYLFDSEDMADYDTVYSNELKKFVDYGNQFKTDLDKVIAIHDKIIDDYDYWQLYDENGNEIFNSYNYPQITSSPMGFFLYGQATCVGYSQLFCAVMEKLGIDVEFCVNENHIWNLVKVDGKWYHIDNTFDDPIYTTGDGKGGVKRVYYKGAHHKYIMVSEATMLADSGHFIQNPWEYTKYYEAQDKSYETNTVFSKFGDVHTMFYKNSLGNYDFALTAGDDVKYTFTSDIKLFDVLHTNIYKTSSGTCAIQFYNPDNNLSQYDIFVGYYDENGVFLAKQSADLSNLYVGNSKVNYYKSSDTLSMDAKKISFDNDYAKSGNTAKLYIWKTGDFMPCSVLSEYEFE